MSRVGRRAGEGHPKKGAPLSEHLSDSGTCAPHEVKDYRHYSKNQKNVDEIGGDMKDEKSA
jgi:hypothetical protein